MSEDQIVPEAEIETGAEQELEDQEVLPVEEEAVDETPATEEVVAE